MNEADDDDPLDKTIDRTGVTDALIDAICQAIREERGDEAVTEALRAATDGMKLPLTYVLGKVRDQLGEDAAVRVERLVRGDAGEEAHSSAPSGALSALRRLFR